MRWMGHAAHWKCENYTQNFCQKSLTGREYLEHLGINVRKIFKWI
jgi:hypothetical protein